MEKDVSFFVQVSVRVWVDFKGFLYGSERFGVFFEFDVDVGHQRKLALAHLRVLFRGAVDCLCDVGQCIVIHRKVIVLGGSLIQGFVVLRVFL